MSDAGHQRDRAVRRIRWAVTFGIAAALAAVFGAAIFAVWDDDEPDGTAAAERTLRDARVLVWVGFAAAAGFVVAGRDRMTSEVDRLFEEDRRVWVRRIQGARDGVPSDLDVGDGSAGTPLSALGRFEDLPPPSPSTPAHPSTPLPPLPLPPVPAFARRGPSSRLLAAGGVLLGAGIGAGLGALAGELAPGAVLGVVAGLLVGLLLDQAEE